jgi:hypothetical protein
VASRYRARGARCRRCGADRARRRRGNTAAQSTARGRRCGADSPARRVASRRAVAALRAAAARRAVAALRGTYCGTANWTRCATHLYVVAEGVPTYMRAPPLESSTAARRAAALRRGYAALHRPALTTQPPRH